MDVFDEMALELERLATAPARAAVRAAPDLAAVISSQHAAGVAPDGAAWPLDKDGGVAQLGGSTVTVEGAAIVVHVPDKMRPHQTGAPSRGLPQRKLVPAPGDALPQAYAVPIERALRAEGLR